MAKTSEVLELPAANTALEYFDGFDDYDTDDIPFWWSFVSPNPFRLSETLPYGIVIDPSGRNRSNAVRFLHNPGWGIYRSGRLGDLPTRTVGAGIRVDATYDGSDTPWFFVFLDGLGPQIGLFLWTDCSLRVGKLELPLGRPLSPLIPASTQKFPLGRYVYVEMRVTIHPTAGAITVKVNGRTWLEGTGLNTQDTANSTCDGVVLGMNVWSDRTEISMDDFYMRGDNVFCGSDVRVISSLPSGVGDRTEFRRGGTTDTGENYSQVNEQTPDADETLVLSAVKDEEDSYLYDSVNVSGQIVAVMNCAVSSTVEPGSVDLIPVYKIGGSSFPGDLQTVDRHDKWVGLSDIQELDPSTNQPWTIAGRNAAQFGMRRFSD